VRPELQEAFVAPRTEIEEAVALIWSQVLRIERVGIHDNFFVLGGHSLLATQLLSHIRETLQVELSLRNFFEAATIAQLSHIIMQQQESGAERQKSAGPAIRALSREAYRVKLSSIPTARDRSGSRN
jgi:acyl carrier protein